jgi:hypothetical protein
VRRVADTEVRHRFLNVALESDERDDRDPVGQGPGAKR